MAEALNRGVPARTVKPRAKLVRRMEALFADALTAGERMRLGRR